MSTNYAAWKGKEGDTNIFVSRFGIDSAWHGPTRLPNDVNTSTGPAITALPSPPSTRLFMAWKGMEGDSSIHVNSSSEGVNFTAPTRLPNDINTSSSPALSVINGRLLLVWKGDVGDQRLHFSLSAPGGGPPWTAAKEIPGANSSTGPALYSFTGPEGSVHAFMAWKGVVGDQKMFVSRFSHNLVWEEPTPLGSSFVGQEDTNTSASPAIAGIQTLLGKSATMSMVWKGLEADQGIRFGGVEARPLDSKPPLSRYHASFHGRIGNEWNTSTSPALSGRSSVDGQFANFGVLMAWKGVVGDQRVFFSHSRIVENVRRWTNPVQIPGANSSADPALSIEF